MEVRDYAPLAPYAARYADLAQQPLRVVCELVPNSRVVNYDPIHLDNLLARLVLEEATGGQSLVPDPTCVYRLPVPLAVLWQDADGLPLYACTPLAPVAPIPDVAYIHKRAQTGQFTGVKSGVLGISSTNGRWMERRIPFPTACCARLESVAIGDPAEVARLLAPVSFVGKRRAIGYGEVRAWWIEPNASWSLVQDGLLARTLPAAAASLLAGAIPEGLPALLGWTPPQWKPALLRPGWPAGTPIWSPACAAMP